MIVRFGILGICSFVFCSLSLAVVYGLFSHNLPDIDELELFQPKRVTKVYSDDGAHLRDFLEENRELLNSYSEVPESMKRALIAIEDRRFFSHWGIDLRRILGAVGANIMTLDPTRQGASTLTQQLARNLYDKVGRQSGSGSLEIVAASYARKIREQITAVHIERLYTKHEILTMYLNTVFFGHGHWGLKSAARFYFDKEARQLTTNESAMLAGLLKAPNNYSPLVNKRKAWERRNLVLYNMVTSGKLRRADYKLLSREPIYVKPGRRAVTYGLAPYFVEYVRQQLNREYGSALYRDGFVVHTTLDSRLQDIAEKHFTIEIGKVQEKVDEYILKKGAEEYFARSDTLAEVADSAVVQAAFVAMDPATGHILAMIGGRDFERWKFNRATQALRQAGSAFKPFVYATAIDNGRFPIDMYDDNAVVITEHTGEIWDPENYDRKFLGPMTLREAFKQSRNTIASKLAMEIDPSRIRQYARNMGIASSIRAVFSIGIGTSAVRLLDMVRAYSVFPNQGIRVEPIAVKRIEDSEGNVIYEPGDKSQEVLRKSVAVVMTDMMRSVIDEPGGTGRSIRSKFRFEPDAAGKTGTTNDYRDAWFIGFTPHLVAGVWVGMDDPSLTLAELPGGVAALPLWAQFMKEVYREVEPYRSLAEERFEYPEDLVTHRAVCEDTHKLATKWCPRQTEDIFIADGVFPGACPALHGQAPSRRRTQRF